MTLVAYTWKGEIWINDARLEFIERLNESEFLKAWEDPEYLEDLTKNCFSPKKENFEFYEPSMN